MTSATKFDAQSMPDVQSYKDVRNIAINEVGIKDLKFPIKFRDGDYVQHTIATIYMAVNLPATRKGTHMSRFVKLLNDNIDELSTASMFPLLETMNSLLNADDGFIEISFPYFLTKQAPVSGLASKIDYAVTIKAQRRGESTCVKQVITIPVTSLCPCSKEISAYSAHNQRSHIIVTVDDKSDISTREIIQLAESQASSELYGLLKRSDEKFVTERAYDNPKFVEDMVRDVANALMADDRISGFIVETENFESIHNHSAYACIRHQM